MNFERIMTKDMVMINAVQRQQYVGVNGLKFFSLSEYSGPPVAITPVIRVSIWLP